MPNRFDPRPGRPRFDPAERSSGEFSQFLSRLRWVAIAIALLLTAGTVSYTLFEDVNLWDGFLWALDTIATEGARNRPRSLPGEITWLILIVLGVGTLLYALVTIVEVFVAGHLRSLLDDRREQRAIDSLTGHLIICGFGRVGRQVARDLAAAGERYVVIDERDEHRDEARGIGVRFIQGSSSDDDVLEHAGITRARALIACVDSDAENVFITLSARQLNADLPIIARASNFDTEPKLRRAGATRVISPYRSSGSEMARIALTPQVGGVVDVAPDYRLEEIQVDAGCAAEGASIAEVRGDAIIVGVRRADGSFIPQPATDTVLQSGDAIIALGAAHTLNRLEGALSVPASGTRS